jgi:hypothetical protein
MSSPRIVVYGVALGLTIIIWVVAYHLAAVLSDKKEPPSSAQGAPVQLNEQKPSSPATSPITIQGAQGPVIISQGQLGGQTAHTITNLGPQPRKASAQAVQSLVQSLKALPSRNVEIEVVNGDAEANALAHQLSQALQSAGWHLTTFATSIFPAPMTGLTISATDNTGPVNVLFTWGQAAGFEPKFSQIQLDRVHILVGRHE